MFSEKHFLIIGAHPDDADMMFGGCAVQSVRKGHKIKFVSTTNGNAGHFSETKKNLAERRLNEAQQIVKISGIEEYEILNNLDGELTASIENRKQIITLIREFKPDVVISHRIYDYHADHRATAQLVQDTAYLVMVPMFCPKIPIPEKKPIYMFGYDTFKKPYPFSPDVVVSIDNVLQEKLQILNCHESQYYEWLPYIENKLKEVPKTEKERLKWLIENQLVSNNEQANLARFTLNQVVGNIYSNMKYAETFELSEYGRQADNEELYNLFSF
jgi:N-acetylglucosamine malate deacetylase 1